MRRYDHVGGNSLSQRLYAQHSLEADGALQDAPPHHVRKRVGEAPSEYLVQAENPDEVAKQQQQRGDQHVDDPPLSRVVEVEEADGVGRRILK